LESSSTPADVALRFHLTTKPLDQLGRSLAAFFTSDPSASFAAHLIRGEIADVIKIVLPPRPGHSRRHAVSGIQKDEGVNMSATLITGLGLVGTSYAQHALKRGETIVFYDIAPRKDFLAHKLGSANVTVVQRDVRDLPSLIETIQKYKCDTVIHTAGLIGGKVANPIYTGLQINVMGTINVAEAVRLSGVKRLVQISTFGIYDRRKGEPNAIDEDFRRGPGEAYGNSKVAKELMVEAYQRLFGFELVVLRLANVYGVGHFAGGSGGGEMVQNMLQTGIKGGVVKIAQEVARDFEYVYYKDLGRALDKAVTTPLKQPVTLNIGTGVVIKFDDLVSVAEKLLPKLQVEIIPGQKPRSAKQPMVIEKAKQVLGWTPEYDIEAGFKDYIEELKALP
jgi:UDP-glucose 4-epimerase